MADQDLEIRIRAEADLAAIKQWESEIDRLAEKVTAARTRISGGVDRGFLAPVPPELLTPGGAFGAGSAGYEGITAKAAEADRVVKSAAESGAAFGINLARARQEATYLVRELATGVPTTRTLSSLLGALGPELLIAAGAGYALNRALIANAQRQLEINQEVGKQIDQTIKLAQEWTKLSLAAKDIPSLAGVGENAVKSLEDAKEKMVEFQNAGISGIKTLSDYFTAGIPGAGKIFENFFNDKLKRLGDDYDRKREAAGHAIEAGLRHQAELQRDAVTGVDEAIERTTRRLEEQKAILRTLNPIENVESWIAVERTIERITADLEKLKKVQQEQQKAGQPTSQLGVLQDQLNRLGNLKNLTPAEERQARNAFVATESAGRNEFFASQKRATDLNAEYLRRRYAGLQDVVSPIQGGPNQAEVNARILQALEKGNVTWDKLLELWR